MRIIISESSSSDFKVVILSDLQLVVNRFKHLFWRFTGTKKYLLTECKPYNLKLKLLVQDGICRDIYYKAGVYSEDYLNRWLAANLDFRAEDLIIDIGANMGWYSMVLSRQSKPTILAFEPEKENFGLLQENIRMNNFTNVKTYNKAVSDKDGILTLHLYKKHNLGRHSFIRQKNSIGSASVQVVALDHFLEQEGYSGRPVKLMKIDIEGYELTALQGALNTLGRTKYILSEFSPDLMKANGQSPMDYINLLRKAGFSLFEISPQGLSEPDLENIIANNQQINLFGKKMQID